MYVRSLVAIAYAALLGCVAPSPDKGAGLNSQSQIVQLPEELSDGALRIREDVFWLADDAREGREAGSAGYEAAAQYVSERMKLTGLSPGVDGDWFQTVPLRTGKAVQEEAAIALRFADGEVIELSNLEDFRVSASLAHNAFDFEAPAVFVGYGVHAPEMGYDDYEGLDVAGKIVVFLTGAPDIFESEQRAHFGSSEQKLDQASKAGAIGAVSMLTKSFEERTPWQRIVANPQSARMTWIDLDGISDTAGRGVKGRAILNSDVARLLFQDAPVTFDEIRAEADAPNGAPNGFEIGADIAMKGASTTEDVTSPNVVGVIEGTDPELRDEFIVLTAHLDHLGINERLAAADQDGLNNGAVDNALGVAVMLEVAARLAESPPARSIIVLAVTAEEKGLLGADYFAHFPTVDREAIVANVNLDMPVMLHDFTDVIGFGAARSTLGDFVREALDAEGVTLSPDPFPELGIFTRSDHYRFVEKGIPSIYLFPGMANGGEERFNEFMARHYHKPSDETSLPVRYNAVARFARLNEKIVRAIADAPERPRWRDGDFFGELFAGD